MNDALSGRLVNLICVGAQKSGTTTLYTILTRHPEMTFAKIKEVQYFGTDPFKADPKGYHAHYKGQPLNRWIADFTPRYLAHPEAAQRIAHYNPQAHIVIILRDPIARAFSHYQMKRRNGNEHRLFEDVVRTDIAELSGPPTAHSDQSVVGRGLYAQQIARYDDHFPREQIHLIRFEDLVDHQEATVNALLNTLGCQPMTLSEPIHANPAFEPQLKRVWQAVSRLPMVYTARLRMVLRRHSRRSSEASISPMNASTKKILMDYYHEDLLALQERTGWDLSDWISSGEEH